MISGFHDRFDVIAKGVIVKVSGIVACNNLHTWKGAQAMNKAGASAGLLRASTDEEILLSTTKCCRYVKSSSEG